MQASLVTKVSLLQITIESTFPSSPVQRLNVGLICTSLSSLLEIQPTNRPNVLSQVLAWYHAHSLPATPINPRTPTITIPAPSASRPASNSTSYSTVASPSALPLPTETSLSIITAPGITKNLLAEAKKVGIRAVWLQPGTYDQEVIDIANRDFEGRWVGGPGGGGSEGWCVLVDGEWGLQEAERKWERRKL